MTQHGTHRGAAPGGARLARLPAGRTAGGGAAAGARRGAPRGGERPGHVGADTLRDRLSGRRLQQFTAALAAALSLDDVARAIRGHVRQLVGAETLVLTELRGSRLTPVTLGGRLNSTSLARFSMPLDAADPIAEAARTVSQVLIRSGAEFRARFPVAARGASVDRPNTWLALPITAPGSHRVQVVLSLRFPAEWALPEEAGQLLRPLTSLVGVAWNRARRHQAEHELSVAAGREFAPRPLPRLAGLPTAVFQQAAEQETGIGGDWYETYRLADGRVALIVGDVEGHDASSAYPMSVLRAAMLAYADEGHGPGGVMRRANHLLCQLAPHVLATCVYLEVDPAVGRARVARAGHPVPLLRRSAGTVEPLRTRGGLPLGVEPDARYPVTTSALEPGAMLALYTDGLVETRRGGPDCGLRRLGEGLRTITHHPPHRLARALVERCQPSWDDDVTLLLATLG